MIASWFLDVAFTVKTDRHDRKRSHRFFRVMQVRNLALGVVARGVDWKKLGFVGTTDSKFELYITQWASILTIPSSLLSFTIWTGRSSAYRWNSRQLCPSRGLSNRSFSCYGHCCHCASDCLDEARFRWCNSQSAGISVEAHPSVVPFVLRLLLIPLDGTASRGIMLGVIRQTFDQQTLI
jgi:hypothetical protein